MQETLKKLAKLWIREVHPRLMSFITAAGVVWLGVCLLLLFGLANLAEEVLEQEVFAFDEAILLWINQFANPVMDQVMLTATRLGDPDVVVPLTCIGVVWLWWRWRWRIAAIFAITCIGGAVLSTGFKLLFGKERPALWAQLITETSYSFPSGHALGSMVLYGFSAYLLAQRFQPQRWLIYGVAVLLIASIGFSRIYLGVHWPTDVVAGYSIGFLWLSLCVGLFQLETRRLGKSINTSSNQY
ncbi:phosphatase PAP2 family protein [Nodosilinea sp. LEGE 07298]|uniref:phosphatase PAP2 family protein n=1 Tax=Nodosilinea sp. LEGE 07298 TaxID=2777970 RepID=UPI0018810EFC|nr:phosphatase PAP2 family protein [Nodosilinea sp. LEGE 07298]MBE9112358.1 phosphatase PAP2 family protein [Nodosilinea sp. LEGE 07298]